MIKIRLLFFFLFFFSIFSIPVSAQELYYPATIESSLKKIEFTLHRLQRDFQIWKSEISQEAPQQRYIADHYSVPVFKAPSVISKESVQSAAEQILAREVHSQCQRLMRLKASVSNKLKVFELLQKDNVAPQFFKWHANVKKARKELNSLPQCPSDNIHPYTLKDKPLLKTKIKIYDAIIYEEGYTIMSGVVRNAPANMNLLNIKVKKHSSQLIFGEPEIIGNISGFQVKVKTRYPFWTILGLDPEKFFVNFEWCEETCLTSDKILATVYEQYSAIGITSTSIPEN